MQEYENRQEFLQAVLLWSLLTNRTDIASLVWRRVANQLYTGLVSALILQEMASIASLKDEELAMKLTEHSKLFTDRVLSMMDNLYRTDREVAFEILDDLETVWTIEARPISFAYESKMYDIIAHPCSVGLMNKIWYNGLIPSGLSMRFWKDFLEQPLVAGSAPCFHFVLHYVFFAVIILLYSYMLLTNLKNYQDMTAFFQMSEIALYVWTGLDFLNDIVSVMGVLWKRTETRRKCRYRFLSRLNDMWKVLGLFCAILVVLTITSRHSVAINEEMPRFAPRSAALLLLFSYLRYMRLLVIHHYTGITLIFLKHMLLTLLRFLITIAFFVLGTGIFFEAILVRDNPDLFPGEWHEWRIWRIFYFPYYQYFGETFEETIGIQVNNDKVDWSVKGIAAIHIMVGNLLILNLIIALFTTTYEKILKKSRLVWQYERYHVIEDFRDRTFCYLDFITIPVHWVVYRCKLRRNQLDDEVESKRNRERQILQYIMAGRSLENSHTEVNT
ncbi:transient receptor potential cation channel subfamily M member-like 2 [Saccostrea cucullata]|uniref:transient receptor potential cation channel subfamily M member-like 2 n=1 Tax=Saccostrea cuccullata TaxID=36930 RepID=UPI002ED635BF